MLENIVNDYEKEIKEEYENRFKNNKRFDREKFEKFKKIFNSFTFKLLQDFMVCAKIMVEKEIDLEDFIEYMHIVKNISISGRVKYSKLTDRAKIQHLQNEYEKMPKCPECHSNIVMRQINIPKGKQNIHGWKLHKMCQKCNWEEYSKGEIPQQVPHDLALQELHEKIKHIEDLDTKDLFINSIKENEEK